MKKVLGQPKKPGKGAYGGDVACIKMRNCL